MITLDELFGLAVVEASWPVGEIAPVSESLNIWIRRLGSELTFTEIVTAMRGGETVVRGKVKYESATVDGVDFALTAFPSFEFETAQEWEGDFLVRIGAASTDVIVENMKLVITTPADFISAHGDFKTKQVAEFTPSGDLKLSTEVRVRFSTDGEFRIEPIVPISIAPAKFMGVSCRGIFDIRFFPRTPNLENHVDWIKRPVDGLTFDGIGSVGIRTLDIDWDDEDNPLVEIVKEMGEEGFEAYEWAFNDLVIPVVQPIVLPVPRHGTVGLRRSIRNTGRLTDYFDLRGSPISVDLAEGVHLVVTKFWFDTIEPPAGPVDGLNLEAGIVWDMEQDRGAALISLEDEWTVSAQIRRSPTMGRDEVPVLAIDLFGIARIDLISAKFGVSIGKLLGGEDFGNSFLAVIDVLLGGGVSSEPMEDESSDSDSSSSSDNGLQLEVLGDDDFSLAITDFGWKFGTFSVETFSLPEGASLKLGPLELILFETGVLYEDDAAYFSISGGIGIEVDGFEVAAWFKRVRGKVSGNPDAAEFKMDGFGGRIGNSTILFEFLGYFTNAAIESEQIFKEEFGLSGTLKFDLQANKYKFGFDLIVGGITPFPDNTDVDAFDYWMLQIAFEGRVPLSVIECYGFRVLFASNMIPKLKSLDDETPELRYYKWSKDADPLVVPPDRRMTVWRPENDAWAVGVGLAVGFTGCGDVFRLSAFGMIIHSPTERGFMIAIELFIMSSPDPIGYAVFEYDAANDRWALGFGVDMSLKHFLDNPPEILADAFKIKASVLISNKPGTFALGRLNDKDSWAKLTIKIELPEDIGKLEFFIGLCVEWVEDVRGGFGFATRGEIGVDLVIISVSGYSALAFEAIWLRTGSGDFALRALWEMGIRVSLLKIIQIGLKLAADIEHLAHDPGYTVFSILFRIETPWFFPDITFTCEVLWGAVEPEDRAAIISGLTDASALLETTGASTGLLLDHAVPAGASIGDDKKLPLGSVLQFRTPQRAQSGQSALVSPDTTILIEFSQPVADLLNLGPSEPSFGERASGDENAELITRYQLSKLVVKRRPRFGDREWTVVEERTPTYVVTDDGVERTPESETNFKWEWNPDIRSEGKTVAKQLNLNGNTPFGPTFEAPEVDDSILRENEHWPCCNLSPTIFSHDYLNQAKGPIRLPVFPVDDVRANVWIRTAFVKPVQTNSGLTDVPDRVLSFDTGVTWRFAAHEDVMIVTISCCAYIPGGAAELVALDRWGEEVSRTSIRVDGRWHTYSVIGPFRTLKIESESGDQEGPVIVLGDRVIANDWLEVNRIDGITVAEYAQYRRDRAVCGEENKVPAKTFFLPHHEYKVEVTTTIGVRHTTTEYADAEVEVDESVTFTTTGYPGTNATDGVGQELAPYIKRAYDGHRGYLYREEPAFVLFTEDLRIVAPTSGSEEHQQEFPVSLVVRSDSGRNAEALLSRSSTTSEDWLASRSLASNPFAFLAGTAMRIIGAISDDPAKLRMSDLLTASGNPCDVSDPAKVEQRATVTQGDGGLWEPRSKYTALVRPQASPWIHRKSFYATDLGVFFRTGNWRFEEGGLVCDAAGTLAFGDADWDLIRISVGGSGPFGIELFDGEISARFDGTELVVGTQRFAATEVALIEAILFSDAIRISAGGQVVDIPRDRELAGRHRIVAETTARVTSLFVHGLDMTQHSFTSSKYTSFREHIGSFTSDVVSQPGDSTAIHAAFVRERANITRVMNPESRDAEREELFQRMVSELVVFLEEESINVGVTAVGDDQVGAIVIESPESIDAAYEVSILLKQYVKRGPGVGSLIPELPIPGREAVPRLPNPIEVLLGIEPPIEFAAIREFTPQRFVPKTLRVKSEAIGSKFSCQPEVKFAAMTDSNLPEISSPIETFAFDEDGARMTSGTQSLVLDPEIARQVREFGLDRIEWFREGRFIPRFRTHVYEDRAMTVLQNTDATKLILFPHRPLDPGRYRLCFEMVRRRFDTVDPENDFNTYRQTAEMDLTL